MKRIVVTLFVVFILGLGACATPPAEEMKKAQDAVILAESDADAVTYAGNILVRARDALTRMQNEADAKRYWEAKNFAAEAISLAERAISEGRSAAARALNEAANLIGSLSGPLAETSNALETAKDMQLEFGSLSQDLDAAQQTYDDALSHFDDDNYRDAASKGETVRVMLSDINQKLTQEVQATSRKQ